MRGSNTYSVVSTRTGKTIVDGKPRFEKIYKTNVPLRIDVHRLKRMIDEYIDLLEESGVPLPCVVRSSVEGERILYLTEYNGENIIDLGFTANRFDAFEENIRGMAHVISRARDADLMLDPHPKNFVFENGRITYVDFYPPYSEEYVQLRMKTAPESHQSIIRKNFEYFEAGCLAAHFCGDFLNIDPAIESFFPRIHGILVDSGASPGGYDDFVETAIAIRKLEDLRIEKGIYLI